MTVEKSQKSINNEAPSEMKILFVDDEFILLESMQLMLLPICPNWEMEFIQSGTEALARMSETSFDVIVADTRMPEMSGPELLDEVMNRFPDTVRFLLLDAQDEAALNASGDASLHEVISKTCDAELFKCAILRACGQDDGSQGDKLEKLVARITRIPSIPALYLELIELMKNPGTGIDEIGAVIAKDMTMTAVVLKMANSAFFGLQRVVTSTTEATMYLGIDTLRSLVLSAQVFSQFEVNKISGFSVDQLWSHSLHIATAAKSIARMEGLGRSASEEAFVAGILHDIGKLVLASNFPEECGEVGRLMESRKIENRCAEEEIFGVNHADVGGHLLKLWDLPQAVVEAITLHHAPSKTPKKVFSALSAVHAADAIINEHKAEEEWAVPLMDREYLKQIGKWQRIETWRQALLNPASSDY